MHNHTLGLRQPCLPYLFVFLVGILLSVPVSAADPASWGTRPYEIEKPIYDQQVKKLEKEIRKAEHRKEQSRSRLKITLGDLSGAEYQEFEKWYNSKEGNRPPELVWQLEDAKTKLSDARQSFQIYATSNGPGPDDPTFGSNVRDSLWPAHLKMLSAQAHYYGLQAWDEQFRLIAAEKYTYSLFVQIYENAITGMQYVMRQHADKFFGDLADCFGRALIQGVGDKLLVGYSHLKASQYPAWLKFDLMPGYGKDSITGTDGLVFSCLDDATRNAVVGLATNGIRYNFVAKVHNTWHVPEEVAEYWWATMINPEDSPDSPWTPHYKSMYDRVTEGAINAVKRAADKNNLVEHTKDAIKFQWERQIRERLSKDARKSAIEWLKSARESQGRVLAPDSVMRNATRVAHDNGRKAVESDTSAQWLKAADYAIMAFETTFKSVYLNVKKAEFEAAAEPIIKEYQRIVACLRKSEMSTSPQSVINIYKLKNKTDVADFFARCEGETPEQTLARGQEINRNLYRILEEAREIYSRAYPVCANTLGDMPDISPAANSEAATPPDNLAERITQFQEKVNTIETNARDGFAKGTTVGQGKIATEASALQVCEQAGHATGTSETATREQNATDALKLTLRHRSTTANDYKAIDELAQTTHLLMSEVAAEADALAAIVPASAPAPATEEESLSRVAEITEKLTLSREAGATLPELAGKAERTYDQQVAVLSKIDNATADRLLDEGLGWLTEIRELAEELKSCQGQLQAVLNATSEREGSSGEEAVNAAVETPGASETPIDVAALQAKATNATSELDRTLELARSYDEAAQSAADNALLCHYLVLMRSTLGQAQSAEATGKSACNAGQQMADKAGSQLTLLQGEIKTLDADAESRERELLKMEAMADKAASHSNDAKQAATRARTDQTYADQLAGNACQRLRDIKSAQSVSDVQMILGEIQSAVSSCKSLAQKVRQSASDAEGSAAACAALEANLGAIPPPSPLPTIEGKARTLMGQIDALDAVAGTAENQVTVVAGAKGQANALLAQGETLASRLAPAGPSQQVMGEMGGISSQIDGLQSNLTACSGEVRARAGDLSARYSSVQGLEQTLSGKIRRINSRLQSGGFFQQAQDAVRSARDFAEIAGWSADGMAEILTSVATCQAVAETLLAEANAAQAACAQRPRMKAIPNPSGSGWACTCIYPKDKYSEAVGGCVADNCPQLEQAFFGALQNKQTDRARSILQQAGSCGFASRGEGYIREVECLNNGSRFISALESNQLSAAGGILSISRDCDFAERGAAILNSAYQNQSAEADAQRRNQQQQLFNNMINTIRNIQGGNNRPPPLPQPTQPTQPTTPQTPSSGGSNTCSGSGGINLLCIEAQGTR